MAYNFVFVFTFFISILSAQVQNVPPPDVDTPHAATKSPQILPVKNPEDKAIAHEGHIQHAAALKKADEFKNTMDQQWYILLDTIGVIAFALSGLITAYIWGASLYGTLLLSFLPPFGGGIIRDLILGRSPLGFFQAQTNISIVFVIVVLGFFVLGMSRKQSSSRESKHRSSSLHQAANLFDGIGLAIFTVTGAMVAVLLDAQPLWLWGPFAAMMTSTGGGLLRDLMLKNHGATVVNGAIYPEIALFWGWMMSCYISCWQEYYADAGVILTGTILCSFASWAMIRAMKIKNLSFGH